MSERRLECPKGLEAPIPTGAGTHHMDRKVEIEFDEFGWEALTDLARRQSVSIEELVRHAAMYYLADADSGRVSHRVPRGARSADQPVSDEAPREA